MQPITEVHAAIKNQSEHGFHREAVKEQEQWITVFLRLWVSVKQLGWDPGSTSRRETIGLGVGLVRGGKVIEWKYSVLLKMEKRLVHTQ